MADANFKSLVSEVDCFSMAPSLKSACMDALLRDGSIENCMSIYSRVSHISEFSQLSTKLLSKIRNRMVYIHERYDSDDLKAILGEEEYQNQHRRIVEMETSKKTFTYMTKGSVLERDKSVAAASEDGYYPYDALKGGVIWPEGVIPTCREEYLSPSEFESIFKMSKEQFKRLDKHMKIRYKKEANLF